MTTSDASAVIPLSFTSPPLNLNQRMHWAQKAKITKAIREEARARALHLPNAFDGSPIEVTLHWLPRDNRRRDADNPILTLKALCDGLVDAGLVDDDTPELMVKNMTVIHRHEKGQSPRMWLEVKTRD